MSGRQPRWVALLVSAIAFTLFGTFAWPARAAAGEPFAMAVPVLMYHRISCAERDAVLPSLWICPRHFRQHLELLRANGWRSVTADGLARKFEARERFGRKRFVISIDDGALDGYTNAFPILTDLGMVATFYVPAGKPGEGRGKMTWHHLRELHAAGHDIANHSMDHDSLPGASDLFYEIERSQRRFFRQLGYRPTTFCYPIGHHDAASRRQVRASGMVLAFTTAYGALERTGDAMRAPRIRVSREESASNVLRKLQPYASGLP